MIRGGFRKQHLGGRLAAAGCRRPVVAVLARLFSGLLASSASSKRVRMRLSLAGALDLRALRRLHVEHVDRALAEGRDLGAVRSIRLKLGQRQRVTS